MPARRIARLGIDVARVALCGPGTGGFPVRPVPDGSVDSDAVVVEKRVGRAEHEFQQQ